MHFTASPEVIADFDRKIKERLRAEAHGTSEDPRILQRRKAEEKLPVARLQKLLTLNQETGDISWNSQSLTTPRGSTLRGLHLRKEGQRKMSSDGYKRITVEGRIFLQHRVVWALTHGEWPEDQIDHKDRNRGNNKPTNLVQATNESNHQNRTDNSSGSVGVLFEKGRKKWKAYKRFGYVMHNIGRYDTPEDAKAARLLYIERYHVICSQS